MQKGSSMNRLILTLALCSLPVLFCGGQIVAQGSNQFAEWSAQREIASLREEMDSLRTLVQSIDRRHKSDFRQLGDIVHELDRRIGKIERQ